MERASDWNYPDGSSYEHSKKWDDYDFWIECAKMNQKEDIANCRIEVEYNDEYEPNGHFYAAVYNDNGICIGNLACDAKTLEIDYTDFDKDDTEVILCEIEDYKDDLEMTEAISNYVKYHK